MRDKIRRYKFCVCSIVNRRGNKLSSEKEEDDDEVEKLLFAPNSGNRCVNLQMEMRLFPIEEQHRADCHETGAVTTVMPLVPLCWNRPAERGALLCVRSMIGTSRSDSSLFMT